MSPPIRRRRKHSPEFKAQLIAQCLQPGTSVAAVAMAHQVNDNLLRTWIRQAAAAPAQGPVRETLPASPRMVPLQLSAPVEPPPSICIHIQRGDTQMHVEWPVAQAALCREWLQGWLR